MQAIVPQDVWQSSLKLLFIGKAFLPGMRAFDLRLLGILHFHSSVTMSFSLLNFWEMDQFTASCILWVLTICIDTFLHCSSFSCTAKVTAMTNYYVLCRFSISWWAYTFPMTAAAIASVQYTTAENSWITQGLAIILSATASITVFILFCSTILHAIVWKSLFPNDLAIAITMKKSNPENSEGRGNMDNADELLNDSQNTHKWCEQPLHETRIKEFNNISKDQKLSVSLFLRGSIVGWQHHHECTKHQFHQQNTKVLTLFFKNSIQKL